MTARNHLKDVAAVVFLSFCCCVVGAGQVGLMNPEQDDEVIFPQLLAAAKWPVAFGEELPESEGTPLTEEENASFFKLLSLRLDPEFLDMRKPRTNVKKLKGKATLLVNLSQRKTLPSLVRKDRVIMSITPEGKEWSKEFVLVAVRLKEDEEESDRATRDKIIDITNQVLVPASRFENRAEPVKLLDGTLGSYREKETKTGIRLCWDIRGPERYRMTIYTWYDGRILLMAMGLSGTTRVTKLEQ